jgi:hypothetical protein
MVGVYACGSEQAARMGLGELRSINIALIVAAGNYHASDASGVGSAKDILEIVYKAVVREIRTNIYQGVGHADCNRFKVSGI